MPIPAVILAAGASRRLGRPKQLVLSRGETLLEHTVKAAIEAGFGPVRVVLGAAWEESKKAIQDLPVEIRLNGGWKEGMASSIRLGLDALPPDAEAVLLLACDQPALDAKLLRSLLDAHRRDAEAVVACTYGDTRGIPALFPRRCLPDLLALRGDRGAKALLQGPDVRLEPFPGGELDIDTPEDLARIDGRPGAGQNGNAPA